MKYTALDAIERMWDISPCPIIHSVDELPKDDPSYGRPSRSRYFHKYDSKWGGREQDYILVNAGDALAWKYALSLAHELGHAFDYHGIHPAQEVLTGPRSSRYRQEVAAVAFAHRFISEMGLSRKKQGKRQAALESRYLHGYKPQGKVPSLNKVLTAMKQAKFTFMEA